MEQLVIQAPLLYTLPYPLKHRWSSWSFRRAFPLPYPTLSKTACMDQFYGQ